jgi:hypothetical protein
MPGLGNGKLAKAGASNYGLDASMLLIHWSWSHAQFESLTRTFTGRVSTSPFQLYPIPSIHRSIFRGLTY